MTLLHKLQMLTVVLLCSSFPMFGQPSLSEEPGTIHYAEGDVLLSGEKIQVAFEDYPVMKDLDELKTAHGRAEVLFSSGVIVRSASDSSFRLLSASGTGHHIEFLAGSLIVEALTNPADRPVTVAYGRTLVRLSKPGLYRFDAKPPTLRVFAGLAVVERAGRKIEVSKDRMLMFNGRFKPAKSKDKTVDSFDKWSLQRTALMREANWDFWLSVRKTRIPLQHAGWVASKKFHVLTYVPATGYCCSAYGFGFLNGVGAPARGGLCESYLGKAGNPDGPRYLQSDTSLYPNPGTGMYPTRVPLEGVPEAPNPVKQR